MKKIYQRAMAIALAGTTLLGAGLWHKHHRISPAPSKQVTKNAEALPTGVSEATLADIRSSLEKQEYHISYDERKKKLQSPNRRNNIRAYYEPGKLTVQTRVDTTGEGFKMELVNEGVFADGKLLYTPEAHAKAEHHENKVLISHNAFTEEFINNEDGVRQNFIIENAPEGTRQLQVKMTAKGLKVEQRSDNELRFYSEAADGQTHNELVYSDLQCWDANKRPLSANLAYVDNRIQISVDVAGAAYPVTIDPIIANGTPQNANKVLQVDQSYMWLGFSVASAGDVNGDGYSDVVIGAPKYDLGEENEGGAFVYKGGPFVLTAIAVTFQSNQKDAQMGYSVASAGDFNGDGFSDVLVGVPYYDKDAIDDGIAKLYLGSDKFFTDPITSYQFGNGHAGALMGITVATAGDISADGFSDVLIGASQDTQGESKEGTVAVCRGSANGNLFSNFTYLQINQPNAQFGYSLAPAGDIDADGFSDIIVGARWYTNGQGQEGEGAAFIYRGGSNGLQGSPTILEGNQYNAAMGNKVSSAGDVNGDGFADILIGAPLFTISQNSEGAVFVYYGSTTGVSIATKTTISVNQLAYIGSSVSCAGDVNDDGYTDIVLGAIHYQTSQILGGAAIVYYGSANGVSQEKTIITSDTDFSEMGQSVSGAGDINGDGVSDLIVGAPYYGNGATNLFYGNATLGSRNNLRLYNTDLTTPINHTQFPQTNFGAGLFTKSFTGRNKGKLVWETKPTGQGFSKGSNNRITNSTQSTASQNAYSNLGTTGFELKNVIDKQGPGTKVRVRVKYDPVLALTGQSYGPWRYLPAYLMGNGTAPVPEEKGGNLSETIEKKAIRLEEGKASEIAKIYPNPVSSRLNIDLKDKDQVQSLRILTATGSVMYQSNELRSFVDVSNLPEGAYFLIITKTDGSLTTRQILIRR
ncbi:FG-GAP-like repeat-containing protein [Dyadobacter fermentans]|uniref:FG-GAP-like repeat-containing protein n=1 Tax=Dyadobacter fermentans TaxID=94254 RepID=UPI001CBC1784|nr:FG-GAP-like repeat-containing protein [Dyadobacter fermentans]MBZ1356850.1 FG-GAP repeat protein [Dyadobacter fermentans]